LADGRRFPTLSLRDILRRACRALAGRSVTARPARGPRPRPAGRLFWRAKAHHTLDPGPAFAGPRWDAWAEAHGVPLEGIVPGTPTQKGNLARGNGRFRAQWLHRHGCARLGPGSLRLQSWKEEDPHERPHTAFEQRAGLQRSSLPPSPPNRL